MRIIFFGTSRFAAQILSYLFAHDVTIVAIVTRPDRPQGRSLRYSSPPVKEVAQEAHPELPILQPEKASTSDFADLLKTFNPDLFVVAAFGEIIKKNLLEIPKKGCINTHTSILPKYRGAAPIQRCLMDGCLTSGVTIMEMALEMDAGDIIESVETSVPEDMTCGELEQKLCELACPALIKVIQDLEIDNVSKTPQDPSKITFAPKILPHEEEINWHKPAVQIHNQIRALAPVPGAWCYVQIGKEKKRMKIKRSSVITDKQGSPASFLCLGKEGWIVACGVQALKLIEVQLEGKKSMKAEEFIKGINQPISFIL
jgi:methionyl-tRNA formyltransferase